MEPLIFEGGSPGRSAVQLPPLDVPEQPLDAILPDGAVREELALPERGELEVVRHFTRLAQRNMGIDTAFYPLGSCTMKYNPKINDAMAALAGFANIHPYQDAAQVQGALELFWQLERWLCDITGFAACSFQPAAGAHGELTSLMMFRAYFQARGDTERTTILVPDSAHGTNPASAAMCGFKVQEIPSNADGEVDLEALRAAAGPHVAGFMLTVPNTAGLFERNIEAVVQTIRDCGGLLYCDGANLNALLGRCRPADLGFDAMHINLHKTFSTPHGGGGPGGGPIAVAERLEPFVPTPVLRERNGKYRWDWNRPQSIGKVRGFYGAFAVMVRAVAYILAQGPEGLRAVADNAVLNANYIRKRMQGVYDQPYDRICMHEFIMAPTAAMRDAGTTTMDIAKRLLDFGMHAPTIYFPLIVDQAIMVEPTETEAKETLDAFCDAMQQIAGEAVAQPEVLHQAPTRTPVERVDLNLANGWRDYNYFRRNVRRPPLLRTHMQAGAVMFTFAGWYMPLFYTGVEDEHRAVRERAGLFDISHMGELYFEGPKAEATLQRLLANDVTKLQPGRAQYTLLCNTRGSVVDDCYLYMLAPERYLLVVNAATREKDVAWIRSQLKGRGGLLTDRSLETGLFSLQGPKALAVAQTVTHGPMPEKRNRIVDATVCGVACLVSQTGYTGESGVEVYHDVRDSERLWNALLEAGAADGIQPIGLGARNTLRAEMAYCLYGSELDEETSPLEADLGWVVKLDTDFIGAAAIRKQRDAGCPRKRVGFRFSDGPVPKQHDPVAVNGDPVGEVTSAVHGVSVPGVIGMAYVAAEYATPGATVSIGAGAKKVDAEIVELPFYRP